MGAGNQFPPRQMEDPEVEVSSHKRFGPNFNWTIPFDLECTNRKASSQLGQVADLGRVAWMAALPDLDYDVRALRCRAGPEWWHQFTCQPSRDNQLRWQTTQQVLANPRFERHWRARGQANWATAAEKAVDTCLASPCRYWKRKTEKSIEEHDTLRQRSNSNIKTSVCI